MVQEQAADDVPRRARAEDADAITEVLVDAFAGDEMWGPWAFPGPGPRAAKRRAVFRILVDGALRHRWVWVSGGVAAASLWYPPGAPELTSDQEVELTRVLAELAPESVDRLEAGFASIEAARPRADHFYLTLLGSAPALAGRGVGSRLLTHGLSRIDQVGQAAYLEAADDLVPLYERFGFEVVVSFVLPDGPRVNGMWRPAAGAAALPNAYSHGRSASGL